MRADDDKMRADDDKITADDDKMRAADDKITADGSPQPKFDFSLWPWPLTYTSGPGNMCIKFQINRSTIDDFRNSEKSKLSLTSRDEKTWLRTSTGVKKYFRSGFRQRTFCNQLEVSTTYDAKVMAHYVFFMFGVILTLTFDLSRSLFLCGVTKFGTLMRNMSRTGLWDCHNFKIFVDDIMRDCNFGMEFYMLKSNIDVFFVTSFLCSLQFFLFHQMEYPKRCLGKKNENFSMARFWDMTVLSKAN